MDDNQRDAVINALFLMAWKDGVVLAEEKSCLDRILVKLGVPRKDILSLINERSQHPPGPGELEKILPDHESRLVAMKMLIAVCFADNDLAMEELDYLYSLAVRLEISADELEVLREEALKIVDPASAPVNSAITGPTIPEKRAVGKIKLD